MSKRILFTTETLSLGGIQRVTSVIVNALYRHGKDVTLYCLDNAKQDFYHVDAPVVRFDSTGKRYIKNQFFRLLKLFSGGKVMSLWQTHFLKYLDDNEINTVVLNPHFFHLVPKIKEFCPSIRIYLWMHNNFDMYVETKKYFNDRDSLLQFAKKADGIICLEKYSCEKWSQYNANSFVLHNPITLDPHHSVADMDSHVISFTSRLTIEQKGLDYLIAIARTLPEPWYINVAGTGVDKNRFLDLIQRAHVENKIILRGALQGQDLLDHYLKSSIFLMTSRWEGFSLVSAEAMSVGLPIVAFDIPALCEVTDDGRYALLAHDGDVEDFCRQVGKLISSVKLRREYSALSLERARSFSLETIVSEWKRIVDE